jgi:hypothetical protein
VLPLHQPMLTPHSNKHHKLSSLLLGPTDRDMLDSIDPLQLVVDKRFIVSWVKWCFKGGLFCWMDWQALSLDCGLMTWRQSNFICVKLRSENSFNSSESYVFNKSLSFESVRW